MEPNGFSKFNLGEELLRAIGLLKFEKPTEVQEQTIPLVLQGKDIVVKSQTGSGKTAAFGIPICEKVVVEEKEPQVLVLTPTRELCVQVSEDLTAIGRFKRLRCAAVYGKQPFSMQERALRQRVHIVVGTPGRTLDHLKRGTLKSENIRFLVIDEADKMLDMGFFEQVGAVIKELSSYRQTMLFSATMPEEIRELCKLYMKEPIEVTASRGTSAATTVTQKLYRIDSRDKFNLLKDILYLENPESCLIFCSRKENVDIVCDKLKRAGFKAEALHGGMMQDDRLKTMKDFKRGEFVFLVSTDVAGRGIDIEELALIINYDVPEEKESYVHRIGRTGRAGKEGIAITFAAPEEEKYIKSIQEYLHYSIPEDNMPTAEQISQAKISFEKNSKVQKVKKIEKTALVEKDITKIYLGAGKKKKLRPGDIVGAILNISGIQVADVGIIDIQDNFSYVDILNGKGKIVFEGLRTSKVKGKEVRVEMAEK